MKGDAKGRDRHAGQAEAEVVGAIDLRTAHPEGKCFEVARDAGERLGRVISSEEEGVASTTEIACCSPVKAEAQIAIVIDVDVHDHRFNEDLAAWLVEFVDDDAQSGVVAQ